MSSAWVRPRAAGVDGVRLLLDIPASTGGPRITRMNELAGLLVVSAAVYFGAVRLILRNAWPCGTVWIVLGVAVALRMLLVIGPIPHDQFIWRSLVYVPATLLLLADLRPRLTIKFRRRVGLGDTVCPLRLP